MVKKIKIKKQGNKKEKNDKIKTKLKEFFNNPIPIIIVLIFIVLILLIFIVRTSNNNRVYIGTISESDIQVTNIHFFTNNDINYFYASAANYSGEEKQVYSYSLGYYVVDDDGNYIELAARSQETDVASPLSDIVKELSGWNFYETSVSDYYFTDEVMANLDNLHLVILASTEADSDEADISIDYEVDLDKLTK